MKKLLIILLSSSMVFASCKKEEVEPTPTPTPNPVPTSLNINLEYMVDGSGLVFDTILYTNAAGNNYSVNRLQYYISNIKLLRSDGSKINLPGVHYIDARLSEKNKLEFNNPTTGSFVGLEFLIGLDSITNQTGALPNILDNTAMAWPVPMGGGYHFMKMEGYFMNLGSSFGYAMHLGRNANVVNAFVQNKSFTIEQNKSNQLTLRMNLNEWYTTPAIYDFNIDGNYSMGNGTAMLKLAKNGADVFNN